MATKTENIDVRRIYILSGTRIKYGFLRYGNLWGNPSILQEDPLDNLTVDTIIVNGTQFTSNPGKGPQTNEMLTVAMVSKITERIVVEAVIGNTRETNRLVVKSPDTEINLGNPFASRLEYGAVLIGNTRLIDGSVSNTESATPLFGRDLSPQIRSFVVLALLKDYAINITVNTPGLYTMALAFSEIVRVSS